MSVLIRGMEMPVSCAECSLKTYGLEGLKCSAVNGMIYRGRIIKEVVDECDHFRHPCCPLIEIASPHGDLIDRDVLIKAYQPDDEKLENEMQKESPAAYAATVKVCNSIIAHIKGQRTIIPAEK